MSINTTEIQIDSRGPRFTASITSLVLIIAILTNSWIPVAVQFVQFAIGGFISPKKAPYGLIFINFVQPKLPKGTKSEGINGPKFAQKVGFVFVLISLIGALFSIKLLFLIPLFFALVAALLNAVFSFCLGCELYFILKKFK